jgi:hypothetical protein
MGGDTRGCPEQQDAVGGEVTVVVRSLYAFPSGRWGEFTRQCPRVESRDLNRTGRLSDAELRCAGNLVELPPVTFARVVSEDVQQFWIKFAGVRAPMLCVEVPLRCDAAVLERPTELRKWVDCLRERSFRGLVPGGGTHLSDAICTCELSEAALDRLPQASFELVHSRARRGQDSVGVVGTDQLEFWVVAPSDATSRRGRGECFDGYTVATFFARLHLHRCVQRELNQTMLEFAAIQPADRRAHALARADLLESARNMMHANIRLGRQTMLRDHGLDEPVVEDMMRRLGYDDAVTGQSARCQELLQISVLSASEAIRHWSSLSVSMLLVVNIFAILGSWASVLQVLDGREPAPLLGNSRWLHVMIGFAVGLVAMGLGVAVVMTWNNMATRVSRLSKGILRRRV